MIEPKYRIKDKADFERIFKRAAELDNEKLGDSFIVEGNHDITYGSIKEASIRISILFISISSI